MADDDVRDALERCRDRLTPARRLFVGFSGGLDSTVLLHAVRTHIHRPVIALHAHHGLHGDADAWQAHCAAFCAARGVELRSRRLEVVGAGRGFEAAAREARHAWFADELGEGDLLLLAHHEDDQAETLMLRLLRGTGPDGLAAMPRERALGRGALLRPFLDLPRSTLATYASREDLRWVDDPSNADERFDRNFLRLKVFPLLEARWPGYRRTLARAARLHREERGAADAADVPRTITSVVGDPGLALADLPDDTAGRALALRAWLRRQRALMPPEARLREFLRQLREGEGAELLWGSQRLTRFGDGLYLHTPSVSPPTWERPCAIGERVQIDGVGTVALRAVTGEGGAGDMLASADGADSSPLPVGEFLLRSRRGGERMRTAAGSRPLKKLLQEARLPPWWRDRVPLLFERQADGEELVGAGPFLSAPRLAQLGLALHWGPRPGPLPAAVTAAK